MSDKRLLSVIVLGLNPMAGGLLSSMLAKVSGNTCLPLSTARSGEEVLGALEDETTKDADILITENMIPDMACSELIAHARDIRKGLPVIVTHNAAIGIEPIYNAFDNVYSLPRPFTPAELWRKVQEVTSRFAQEG